MKVVIEMDFLVPGCSATIPGLECMGKRGTSCRSKLYYVILPWSASGTKSWMEYHGKVSWSIMEKSIINM